MNIRTPTPSSSSTLAPVSSSTPIPLSSSTLAPVSSRTPNPTSSETGDRPDPGTAYVPAGYRLVFNDEFDGALLDTDKM